MKQGAGWLLAIDTATATIVVAAGSTDGALLAEEAFEGRYRHSQELLPAIVRLTERADLRLVDLAGIVAGTGPGAFTGLRVGLATAKTLAHELGRPIVGVSTAESLLAAVEGADALWLPSGPRDRVLVTPGAEPVVVRGEADPPPAARAPTRAVAVDLDGRAPDQALALGREAVTGLGAALLRLGAARLARGEADEPERLVPAYASAPRGMPLDDPSKQPDGGVAWSRDPR
ncbi:MAG TPA: tRNA (adenosine(37)-N6)-threonylcarbamoyltransferase complex dimerization subunit type 1 TsaB [Candidatus Limnocylindrales bacterium]|nr:tRNA (adenosine(37)-N6)-threonylcarbamoyltransferase complex dimerization subunit type 1 TsaB [Candidatus Limnocylindrales bacterium]